MDFCNLFKSITNEPEATGGGGGGGGGGLSLYWGNFYC